MKTIYHAFVLYLLLLCTLVAPARATAQDTLAISLSDAVGIGLENNYNIRRAENNVAIARLNDDWSLAGRSPTISAVVDNQNTYTNNSNPASVVIQSSNFSTGVTPGLELNWVLFDGSRVRLTKSRLEQEVALSEGQLRLEIENNVQQIMLAYYDARLQQEQIDVLASILDRSRDFVNYQETRREFGQANTFDLLQARDAYLNDSTNYLIQLTGFENAVRNLKQIMGVDDPFITYRLTDSLSYDPAVYERAALEQRLLSFNRTLQNAQIDREIANLNTRIQEAALRPTVNLQSGVNYNVGISFGSQTFNFGSSDEPIVQSIPEIAARRLSASLGLRASYVLFDGGARKRRIEIARLGEITSQLAYESQRQQLRIQLDNTLASYANQQELVTLAEERADNALRNLEITNERFRGGLINSLDVRQVQVNYLNAQQQRLNAIFNLKNTETDILRLTGQIVQ